MAILVRAYPLLKPVADLGSFAAEVAGARKADADRFYQSYGVSHESWHVQETPHGRLVISVTILDDPQDAAPRYAMADARFDAWFKAQVLHLTGIDSSKEPLGPPTTQVFAWSRDAAADPPADTGGLALSPTPG